MSDISNNWLTDDYNNYNVKNDDFILLVTHQVVISEITKISPPSGGIVIYNTINKKAKLIRNITN